MKKTSLNVSLMNTLWLYLIINYLNIKDLNIYLNNNMEKILSNEVFLKDYNEYKKNIDVDKLRNFFDDIETNRNYFRLNLKKSKKFINKNNDTLTIKNINSNINKCTEDNMDNIIKLIMEDLNKNEHLLNLVIESVLEKCILHNNYIYIYINIIKKIKEEKDITRVLNNTLEKYYKFIFEEEVEKSDNIYDNLCNENKRNDNKIGYLMLMTYLDKHDIIKDKINDLLKNIMNDIFKKDNDDIYKLLSCIFNICLISKEYLLEYLEDIKKLKDKKYNSKVRCKVMDIEDLF